MKRSAKSPIATWIRHNMSLIGIYSIGFIVVILQLRSIL